LAYDIDPLFHFFYKRGTKGLLLANLDIAPDSCVMTLAIPAPYRRMKLMSKALAKSSESGVVLDVFITVLGVWTL